MTQTWKIDTLGLVRKDESFRFISCVVETKKVKTIFSFSLQDLPHLASLVQ